MSSAGNVGEQHVTGEAQPRPPYVFISYSHDSPEHKHRVRALAERLLSDGVDVILDQYEADSPPEGWPRWMDRQITEADYVVLVCTETYRRRVESREQPGLGHGVLWEAHLVYQHIYNAATRNKRFIPVLLTGANFEDIPTPLQSVSHYRPETNDGYEAFYRRITGQSRVVKPQLGPQKTLRPDTVGVWPTAALPEESPSKPSVVSERKTRTSNVWFSIAGYLTTLVAALFAYLALQQRFTGNLVWLQLVVPLAAVALVLFGHTLPALKEQHGRIRLRVETGDLKPGYFRLSPRDDEKDFTRADNKHDEILRWLKERHSPVLYLTGDPGSGKSSILLAWVIPKLSKDEPSFKVIQLRGYQDPLAALVSKLREPGVIWDAPPADMPDIRQLLERACRDIQPQRLLIIFDQFEEFVILHDETQRAAFEALLASLVGGPVDGLTLLVVLRSDYVEILEELALPKLLQHTNWKAVPPFTEHAALAFLRGSGLNIDAAAERDVLREAAEIEQTKGLIRPVTLNLCGLVLGRFATGLPRGFRPGGMIRSFVHESVELPRIREVTPKLIPHLITQYVTKRPRTVTELAEETGLEPATIRGCLRVLGQPERGIVRPLDREQERWEISHDFLVPLLDAIFARWSLSLWRRTRPFLPWIAAASMALVAVAVSLRPKDPIAELTEIGWQVTPQKNGIQFSFSGQPRWPESARFFRRLRQTSIVLSIHNVQTEIAGIEVLRDVKSLTSLNLIGSDANSRPQRRVHLRLPTNLTPLRELKSLTSLALTFTKVTDLGPLRELQSLTSLNLSNTEVADLTPLRELKSLTSLNLDHTKMVVADFGLKSLTSLNLGPLRKLQSLSSLNLSNTEVADLTPLRKLQSLTSLNLSHTEVADLGPLHELNGLSSLTLTSTKVIDLGPLRELKSLSSLTLRSTKVIDLGPLRDLKSLSSLDLMGTRVTDRQTVKMLKQRGVKIVEEDD